MPVLQNNPATFCPQDNTDKSRCRNDCVVFGRRPVGRRGNATDSEFPAPRVVGYCALHFYHKVRPHRSLDHDSPVPRPVQLPDCGKVIELPLAVCITTTCGKLPEAQPTTDPPRQTPGGSSGPRM